MTLEDELRQFTGTEHYYRNFTGLLYTDGIKYLAENAHCYWLVDLVGSYQRLLRHVDFQLWRLEVAEDRSAVVTMVEDVGEPELVRQEIPYTDFPLQTFDAYCQNNVLYLRSEH